LEFCGVFEPAERSGGNLRSPAKGYAVRPEDPHVPPELVKRFGLRGGELVTGRGRPGRNGRKPATLQEITALNDQAPDLVDPSRRFEELTVINPERRIRFETDGGALSMRVLDLLTPVGLGQRALIVAAPRTGKTVLLQQIAAAVAENHPEVYMLVLLIDERPEEVTEMRRTVHGEVVASSNDRDIASHVRIARLMLSNAKRRVEAGQNVLILLDSLTRLGRAFNAFIRGSGRIMSGGLDIRALAEPKSMFGAARTIENGGSLTIIASVLVETGSRMDDVIFNEFKGTGNMEIMLSRQLANKRIWPAMDLHSSGTRKEELLLSPEELEKAHQIRRATIGRPPDLVMEELLDRMGRFPNNAAFVKSAGR
jgi:transcription termination factor Rho